MPSGKQIRAARAWVGWDREDLAQRIGLSSMTVQNIELEIKRPRQKTLDKIIRAFSEVGIEFSGERGIELRDDKVRTIDGKDCYARLLDEVYENLNPEDEFLILWADETLSPPVVHEAYKRIVRKGIRYRKFVNEGSKNIYGPLSWYRYIPQQYYQNASAVFYQDKSAYLTHDWRKVIILKDQALSEANKKVFNWIWSLAEGPTETVAKAPYKE